MTSLTKMKAQTQSRMSEEKRNTERKRNLIILMEKYLLTLGCIESVNKLEQETQITLQKWDTADNIDLFMIFLDYQQYYEARFGKVPKVVKKVDDTSTYEQLKKKALRQKQLNQSINKTGSARQSQKPPPSKPNFKKKDSISNDKQKSQKNIELKPQGIQIQGNSMNTKKKEDDEEKFDVRVLKGIPDYSDVPEFKQLAAYLQRDILVENPNVNFEDIIGLDRAKALIMEAVTLPLKYPQLFSGITQAWKGILLYGPPGTGKTMLAKAVATKCKTTFFNISASSVVSKWRGQSEKLIRILFELARFYQPSTIFIDEIDSIISQRSGGGNEHEGSRRMKTQLLIQMEGLLKKSDRVFVLAASNIPWDLDDAMLRRLEKRILVDLPSQLARKNMVIKLVGDRAMPDIDYDGIATRLQGYSGSDIYGVCKEAAMAPVRRILFQLQGIELEEQPQTKNNKFKPQPKPQQIRPDPVSVADFQSAIKTVKRAPGGNMKKYEQWNNSFGSA